MKYLRVVLAVPDEDVPGLTIELDEFIESSASVHGAHVSAPYATREEALGDHFHNQP
jgi:hypothetical protein